MLDMVDLSPACYAERCGRPQRTILSAHDHHRRFRRLLGSTALGSSALVAGAASASSRCAPDPAPCAHSRHPAEAGERTRRRRSCARFFLPARRLRDAVSVSPDRRAQERRLRPRFATAWRDVKRSCEHYIETSDVEREADSRSHRRHVGRLQRKRGRTARVSATSPPDCTGVAFGWSAETKSSKKLPAAVLYAAGVDANTPSPIR